MHIQRGGVADGQHVASSVLPSEAMLKLQDSNKTFGPESIGCTLSDKIFVVIVDDIRLHWHTSYHARIADVPMTRKTHSLSLIAYKQCPS